MSSFFTVKEEYSGGSSSYSWQQSSDYYQAPPPPRPMEGLNDVGPPPFLIKTYDMVDDLSTAHIVSWSRGGQSFVVWDPNALSNTVLPRYFKHSNFSSFVRQLNTYGFRKIDSNKWEFANESFLRFQKHLLKNIRRKKTSSQISAPPDDLKQIGKEEDVDQLRQEKRVLTMEIVKLRHQQMKIRYYLKQMEMKIQSREKKQQKMMGFLAKAMHNPEFIDKLIRRKKELELEGKKRRGMVEVKVEPTEVDELEALALEMQGYGKVIIDDDVKLEEVEELGSCDEELDEGFWDELLNEGDDDENGFAYR